MTDQIGLIGIGNMGEPISLNLLKNFGSLWIYDVHSEACETVKKHGAVVADSPVQVAEKCDIILLVVPGAKEVEKVLFSSSGISQIIDKEILVVDMTTSDPRSSVSFSKRLAEKGIDYLDAPMTGGVIGAKDGQLLLMIGGQQDHVTRCWPVFQHISKKAFHLGKVGSGHLMKLIHNQLSHATFLAACEAVFLGQQYDLSVDTMIEVFNQGNARSYATEVRFPKFILPETYDMGATFNTVYKDISLVREIGQAAGVKLPINDCTHDYWEYGVKSNQGEEDCTKIFPLLNECLLKNAS